MTTSLRLIALAVLVSLAVVGPASDARAFTPASQNEYLEVPLPEFAPLSRSATADAPDRREVVGALEARYGGKWSVHAWNDRSQTPHYVYGRSVPVSAAVADAVQLEQVTRQVIAANPEVFRATPADLTLSATPHALGKWVAHYQQTYHGIDVWQGKVLVSVSDAGRLLLMGSDFYSDIAVDPHPTLSRDEAIGIAVRDLPYDPATDTVEDEVSLLVLPVPLSATEVEHHLVWRVRVRTDDPLGIWVTHVDAHSGEVIWRYNDIHFAYEGTAEADIRPNTYCNGNETQAQPHLRLNVEGLGSLVTELDGTWTIDGSGGPRQVTGDLYGPYVDLNNVAGAEAFYSGVAEEAVPLAVRFDDENSQRDERDTFDAVNDIHDFFQRFAPEFSYAHQRIIAYVSRTTGYCPGNAWWDGTINFCAEGGGYANTGEMQIVVHHEYGHGIQDAILGWQGNQGLGEGNGDIISNLMSQESIIGRGFFLGNCLTGIRDSDNDLIYPDDVIGEEIHYAGQVIAGFHWDAMMLLQSLYGVDQGTLETARTWHYGRVLLQPGTQPDQVFATFFADDDDGDLGNGTPHHEFYCQAASNHNFECPEILLGVYITHASRPYSGDPNSAYAVDCSVETYGGGVLIPGSMTLYYRIDGGPFFTAPLTPGGGENVFVGSIPPVPLEATIEYYLEGQDDAGYVGTSPRTAPDALHYFRVDHQFYEDMEIETAWNVGAEDDDASTGIWERVDPVPTSAQPGDDHTEDGTQCWVTGQHPGGGDGANDVDSGKTTLYSPQFDLAGAESVSLSYWRWYSNSEGNAPNSDYWDVDITNDGGMTWSSVEHTDVSSNAWVQIELDLAELFSVPGLVQLRFVASDEGEGSLVEAAVDDFTLVAVYATTGVGDLEDLAVRYVTSLSQNAPNPFNPRTEIAFSLSQPSHAQLQVFDVRGQLVKSLVDQALPAGEHTAMWHGVDQNDRPVATGVYFYRLTAEGRTLTKRMLLVK